MMKTLKSYLLLLIAAIITSALPSCKKTDSTETGPVQVNRPSISAGNGDTIMVTGNNLAAKGNTPVIKLNDEAFKIISLTNTGIKAVVPKLAGSGVVEVTLEGKMYYGPTLTYKYNAVVTTLAGSGEALKYDGKGAAASFNCPWGITVDDDGTLYVADDYNRLIRKITADGNVTSIGIPVTINGANFYSPYDIALDKTTHTLYVTDFNRHLLKISNDNSMAVIYDGDMATSGIAVGPDGYLYMGNNSAATIFQLSSDGSSVKTYTSDISLPRNIVFDGAGNMFAAGFDANKMQPAIFEILKGGATQVVYHDPAFKGYEIAVDKQGNFYEADHLNNVIKIIDKSGNITTIAGSGDAKDIDG
ncbi:MAG: IPT/TIG domain-containing protein, partial [Bacteroidetes bacterium]|nr:IPT/TIG domain-containing protein [Bacteroidota bacterium]